MQSEFSEDASEKITICFTPKLHQNGKTSSTAGTFMHFGMRSTADAATAAPISVTDPITAE